MSFWQVRLFLLQKSLKPKELQRKKLFKKQKCYITSCYSRPCGPNGRPAPRRKALNLRELATICFVGRNENANDKRTEQNYK